MGHFFVFMQLYSWAAVEKGAMNKFVEEDWARIFCNVVVGVQVSTRFLFSLQELPLGPFSNATR